ncbi:MAG: VWA domain-containing protein [Planctomycetaceae bacterium]
MTSLSLQRIPAVFAAVAVMLASFFVAKADKRATAAPKQPRSPKEAVKAADKRVPRIQIAILLDTSNSMDGLINQARQQLWTIVNEFATARQNGKQPAVEVALLQYGNNRLPAKEGYIELVTGFTDNLDVVSEKLFALKTSGGSEYCGQVIDVAVKSLAWTKSDRDLKTIYIAGNEPFTQGPVDFRKACKSAVEKSVIVNTIHCGSLAAGISGKWKEGAVLADGSFVSINQNRRVVAIKAPQDKQIIALSTKLNTTYIAYGDLKKRNWYAGNQKVQDANAAKLGRYATVNRAFTKGGRLYQNWQWDLVDAFNQKKVDLTKIKTEHLPKSMQKLSLAEKKAYIKKKSDERVKIQAQMKKLKSARDTYVGAERRKLAKTGKANALETAVINTLRAQAAKKKFTFGK